MESLPCGLPYDYYWRDYTGVIPRDALEGGRDINNRTTYIGQVYVQDHGIVPVTIYPGKKSVVAPMQGVHHLERHIKVLCSPSKQNFRWIPANAKYFHMQTVDKHVVLGGVEYDRISYIGRIFYEGEVIIAKVCGFNVGDAKFWFPADNEEKNVDCYEVLIYDVK